MFHLSIGVYDARMSSPGAAPLVDLLQQTLRLQPDQMLGTSEVDRVVAAAAEHFLAEERVDMRSLAQELGIGRTTLYRWFGDREHLLGRVLWVLSEQTLEWLAAQAPLEEKRNVLVNVEAFMEVTSTFPPLLTFMSAEPAVALRTLLEPTSPLVRSLALWTAPRLADAGYGVDRRGPSATELAEVLVSVTSTYCWARVIAGGEADVSGAMRAVRVLLRAPN